MENVVALEKFPVKVFMFLHHAPRDAFSKEVWLNGHSIVPLLVVWLFGSLVYLNSFMNTESPNTYMRGLGE
jgi:hypothetical protein